MIFVCVMNLPDVKLLKQWPDTLLYSTDLNLTFSLLASNLSTTDVTDPICKALVVEASSQNKALELPQFAQFYRYDACQHSFKLPVKVGSNITLTYYFQGILLQTFTVPIQKPFSLDYDMKIIGGIIAGLLFIVLLFYIGTRCRTETSFAKSAFLVSIEDKLKQDVQYIEVIQQDIKKQNIEEEKKNDKLKKYCKDELQYEIPCTLEKLWYTVQKLQKLKYVEYFNVLADGQLVEKQYIIDCAISEFANLQIKIQFREWYNQNKIVNIDTLKQNLIEMKIQPNLLNELKNAFSQRTPLSYINDIEKFFAFELTQFEKIEKQFQKTNQIVFDQTEQEIEKNIVHKYRDDEEFFRQVHERMKEAKLIEEDEKFESGFANKVKQPQFEKFFQNNENENDEEDYQKAMTMVKEQMPQESGDININLGQLLLLIESENLQQQQQENNTLPYQNLIFSEPKKEEEVVQQQQLPQFDDNEEGMEFDFEKQVGNLYPIENKDSQPQNMYKSSNIQSSRCSVQGSDFPVIEEHRYSNGFSDNYLQKFDDEYPDAFSQIPISKLSSKNSISKSTEHLIHIEQNAQLPNFGDELKNAQLPNFGDELKNAQLPNFGDDLNDAQLPNFGDDLNDAQLPNFGDELKNAQLPNFGDDLNDAQLPNFGDELKNAQLPNFGDDLNDAQLPNFGDELKNAQLPNFGDDLNDAQLPNFGDELKNAQLPNFGDELKNAQLPNFGDDLNDAQLPNFGDDLNDAQLPNFGDELKNAQLPNFGDDLNDAQLPNFGDELKNAQLPNFGDDLNDAQLPNFGQLNHQQLPNFGTKTNENFGQLFPQQDNESDDEYDHTNHSSTQMLSYPFQTIDKQLFFGDNRTETVYEQANYCGDILDQVTMMLDRIGQPQKQLNISTQSEVEKQLNTNISNITKKDTIDLPTDHVSSQSPFSPQSYEPISSMDFTKQGDGLQMPIFQDFVPCTIKQSSQIFEEKEKETDPVIPPTMYLYKAQEVSYDLVSKCNPQEMLVYLGEVARFEFALQVSRQYYDQYKTASYSVDSIDVEIHKIDIVDRKLQMKLSVFQNMLDAVSQKQKEPITNWDIYTGKRLQVISWGLFIAELTFLEKFQIGSLFAYCKKNQSALAEWIIGMMQHQSMEQVIEVIGSKVYP
ncbi:Sialidase [Hexamita inflata]|uniref:Sialidase n=1 Tax=Hexamita inflata TaxID=28002 RepID=A0AA86QEE2_9EUKA|nr:Sialidase [Hexamita inflata]